MYGKRSKVERDMALHMDEQKGRMVQLSAFWSLYALPHLGASVSPISSIFVQWPRKRSRVY